VSTDTVISVEHLSKCYRIGLAAKRPSNLREALQQVGMAPFRYLRTRLRGPTEEELIWALRDVSFEVKRGEVLGVIGRNGAGKSTLLKILSRITDPTEGWAVIRGRVNSLLEVGTGFHPELTGRENIYMNAAIHGMKRAEIKRKLDEIVAFAEVEKFLDTPVKRYSSGMYVRLAFAVAAHLEPDVLLVDEVLAVGDVSFQQKCITKMGEVGRAGRTVLVVSHNMASIANLCGRALHLDAGRIVHQGEARSVIQQYIAATGSAAGERVWTDLARAPGNDLARLCSVRILQEGCPGPTADVDIAKDVQVEITYRCLREGTPLYAALWLKDDMGTEVLSTSNSSGVNLTEDPWYGKPLAPGMYRSVCRIPAHFLNDRGYSIAAIIGKPPSNTIALEDYAVYFRVQDTGAMRKEYYGQWLGVVRPRLAWHTERMVTDGAL